MGPYSQSKDTRPAGVLDRRTLVVIIQINPVIGKRRKWTSQENKIAMECYLLSEPKIRGYQANTICRNSWITELEIEELERKVTGSDSVIEEARSVEALPDNVGEDVRNILPKMGKEEQADSLDEEEVVIVKWKLQK